MSISKGPIDGNFKGSFVDFPVAKRESIVLKIRIAKSNATGTKEFVSSVLLIIMQTLFFTLIVGLSLALPISKVGQNIPTVLMVTCPLGLFVLKSI